MEILRGNREFPTRAEINKVRGLEMNRQWTDRRLCENEELNILTCLTHNTLNGLDIFYFKLLSRQSGVCLNSLSFFPKSTSEDGASGKGL